MLRYLKKAPTKLLKGVALLRIDLNTIDDWRLEAALPTIKFLENKAKAIVIISHKGRPFGFQKKYSLESDAKHLESTLRKKIIFIPDFNFIKISETIKEGATGKIYLLQNLRFFDSETKNDLTFAHNLSTLADYYVNDAFPVSHRENASICAITKYLPSYLGLQFEAEIKNLSSIMDRPKEPLVMIFGGAKADDKLSVIHFFKKKAQYFLLGGVLANTLLKLKNVPIGKSLYEKKITPEIKKLVNEPKIILPIDYRIEDEKIYDIGPKTESEFIRILMTAKTIVWNGPLGLTEREKFSHGTHNLMKAILANKKAFRVLGGGETVSFAKKVHLESGFNFISTGGGAMLDFLAGEKLPGIIALEENAKRKFVNKKN